jgi:hypothetical protein
MKLLLDQRSVIASAKGWLYVINRTGLTKIKADHIDEVHERVKCYLNGAHEGDELLSAVSAEKRPVLKKYLNAMNEAGALRKDDATPDLSLEVKQILNRQDSLNFVFEFNGKKVSVSLDGRHLLDSSENDGYDADLTFVSRQEMNTEWRNIWQGHKYGPHLLYVVEQSDPGLPLVKNEVDRRKSLATWLIASSRMDTWNTRTARLYELDSRTLALAICFTASLDNSTGQETASPELVRATEDEQIPLVIAKAEVPYYFHSIAGCGMEYKLLSEELKREFIVQAVLTSETRNGRRRFLTEFKHWKGLKAELRRTDVNPEQGWTVAGSLLDLRIRTLEHFAWELAPFYGEKGKHQADLLQLEEHHPQTSHLIEVLRLRRNTLKATLTQTANGLYICRAGRHRAYSFLKPKAVRDVLLAATKDIFYGDLLNDVAIKHECDFANFANEDKLQRLVARQTKILDDFRIDREFTFRHFHQNGSHAWFGKLLGRK